MSLTLTDRAVQAFYLLAPNPGPVPLPGPAEAKANVVIGWGLTAAGIISVLCLVGAGIMFMFNRQQQQSNGTAKWVAGIGGGLLLATSAGAVITALQ